MRLMACFTPVDLCLKACKYCGVMLRPHGKQGTADHMQCRPSFVLSC